MSKIDPPFRADHVGSLLRPPAIHDARARLRAGSLDEDELREIEDREIAALIPRLAATGIRSITDGELRREWFHLDFLQQLGGITVEGMIAATSDSEETVHQAPPRITVTGRLTHDRPIQVADYAFVAANTPDGYLPKVAIPSPTMAHFRGGRAGIDIESYPDLDPFFDDLAQVYRDEIAALYAAGCRYVQLDDTNLAYLCDPGMRQGAVDRGDDPDELPRTYAALINAALADRPTDLTVAVHLCRGNFRSTHFATGGYEPVAEVLFNELAVDAFFLEYDDERSGDFAPLRFVPDDKTIVLGLVTSKFPRLEPADDLASRIDDAARHVDLDQLCLSPQCGFSSTIHGNVMTEEQLPQLRRVISAIGHSIPGMISVIGVLCLVFYVSAVLCTKLFGSHPDPRMHEWFGSIGASAYTLFQIMTLESWSMGIVRPTMELFPHRMAILRALYHYHKLCCAEPVHRDHRRRHADGAGGATRAGSPGNQRVHAHRD